MIIIYLIITILILLLLIFNNKEYFNDCNYIPWGPTEERCIKNCEKDDQPWKGSCDTSTCEEICKYCDNERCEWVSLLDINQYSYLDNKIVDNDNNLLPKSLEISTVSTVSTDRTNIQIEVTNPSNNINKYMIHILDLSNPLNKVDVFFKAKDSTSKITPPADYNFEINRNYSINVYALNEYGISNPSNTLII